MIILDPIFIHRSQNGLYAEQAEENLNELKRLMKDIIVKETESTNRTYSWPVDNSTNSSDATTQTGGKLSWAKRPMLGAKAKKIPKVKTFSL